MRTGDMTLNGLQLFLAALAGWGHAGELDGGPAFPTHGPAVVQTQTRENPKHGSHSDSRMEWLKHELRFRNRASTRVGPAGAGWLVP